MPRETLPYVGNKAKPAPAMHSQLSTVAKIKTSAPAIVADGHLRVKENVAVIPSEGKLKVQQMFCEDLSKKPTLQVFGESKLKSSSSGRLPSLTTPVINTNRSSGCLNGDKRQQALTPQSAIKHYGEHLTHFEMQEILDYPKIYFVGQNAKKLRNLPDSVNNGFDDNQGSYHHVPHDHIAYRYEVIKFLGKGSFGQVVKAYDHREKVYVALKMVKNDKRFHKQVRAFRIWFKVVVQQFWFWNWKDWLGCARKVLWWCWIIMDVRCWIIVSGKSYYYIIVSTLASMLLIQSILNVWIILLVLSCELNWLMTFNCKCLVNLRSLSKHLACLRCC